MKHEKAPTAPQFEGGIDYLVYAHVLENQSFWDILANFRWPKVSSTHQDLSFEPIHMSLRPSITKKQPGKSHILKNRCFWTFWPILDIFGGRIWPKLSKGTSIRQDISYKPIPRSLRPSVAKKQPGKTTILDILAKFGHFWWPNLAKTFKRHTYRPISFI